jgi:hypothetical protein
LLLHLSACGNFKRSVSLPIVNAPQTAISALSHDNLKLALSLSFQAHQCVCDVHHPLANALEVRRVETMGRPDNLPPMYDPEHKEEERQNSHRRRNREKPESPRRDVLAQPRPNHEEHPASEREHSGKQFANAELSPK